MGYRWKLLDTSNSLEFKKGEEMKDYIIAIIVLVLSSSGLYCIIRNEVKEEVQKQSFTEYIPVGTEIKCDDCGRILYIITRKSYGPQTNAIALQPSVPMPLSGSKLDCPFCGCSLIDELDKLIVIEKDNR